MTWKKVLLEGDAAVLSDTVPNTIEPDDSASAGIATEASRQDHEHAIVTAVPTGDVAESASADEGTATSFVRSDHVHAAPASWTPASHALSGHTAATADIDLAGNQPTDMVIHTVADATALGALTAVVGKVAWQTDTLHPYVCTAV